MIHKLVFSNFYSFKDEVEILFEVNKKAPETSAYADDILDTRVTKLMTVVGANASGKTNVLRALSFLPWFMKDSFSHTGDGILLKPFLFASSTISQPTRFLFEFSIGQKYYRYELEVTAERVLFERLSSRGAKFKVLFERVWNGTHARSEFAAKSFGLPKDFPALLRGNASVISTAVQLGHEESIDIANYLKMVSSNTSESGKQDAAGRLGRILGDFTEHPDLFKQAQELLAGFDLGVKRIDIHKEAQTQEGEEGPRITAMVLHPNLDDPGTQVPLPLIYESSGTRNLICHLGPLLVVLKHGGMAILDELDADLHPLMVSQILKLFTSSVTNPHDAQLIFSTHSMYVLNELDKPQILLVEKDQRGVSDLWSLNDMNVRADDNFFAKYMAGAYGATPTF